MNRRRLIKLSKPYCLSAPMGDPKPTDVSIIISNFPVVTSTLTKVTELEVPSIWLVLVIFTVIRTGVSDVYSDSCCISMQRKSFLQ